MRVLALLSIPIALFLLRCSGTDILEGIAPPDESVQRLSISLAVPALGRGESATATVRLPRRAPIGGAEVELSTSDAESLAIPAVITIRGLDDEGTFVFTNSYDGKPKEVTISATYDSASASSALFVPDLPPEPPVCRSHACTRGELGAKPRGGSAGTP